MTHRRSLDVSGDSMPHLADHRVHGMIVLPGSAYLDLAIDAVAAATGDRPSTMDDVSFEHAFVVPATGARSLEIAVTPGPAGAWEFTATDPATHVVHARARIGCGDIRDAVSLNPADDLWQHGSEISGEALYTRLRAMGNDFGPHYQGVLRCRTGNGWAVGELRATPARAEALDTAMQVMSVAADVTEHPVMLAGCAAVRLRDPDATAVRAYARLRPRQTGNDLVGDVLTTDEGGHPVTELVGVRFRPVPRLGPATTVAIAATFTAEPLQDALSFWLEQVGLPGRIEFAPYNQVFGQLLAPDSLLAANSDGVNVVLVRLADLRQPRPAPELAEIERVLDYEAEFLYDEIFVRESYLRHGIELPPGACVFDVGANIGMFSLFVRSRCAEARIFAFEPAPEVFDVLRANVGAHARLFDVGLADTAGLRPFTYYPRSTAFSGFTADTARDSARVEAVVRNIMRTRLDDRPETVDALVRDLTADRMAAEVRPRPVRTLSSVVTEYAVDRIDLLKIDTEGSEPAVLAGIDERHWPLIRQVVAEVHDSVAAERVRELLARHGFDVVLDDDPELLRGTGFVQVFARRPDAAPTSQEQALLQRNVDDLAAAFETFQRRSAVPGVAVLCPAATQTEQTADAEARLAGLLADLPGLSVITPAEIEQAFPGSGRARLPAVQSGGIPYARRYYVALASMIARRFLAWRQSPAKVVVLDCDNTLWAGACGEDGPDGVRIDEAGRAVQEFAVRLHESGTLVCLCSKNDPADVWRVFQRHPDMPLGRGHLAAHRIGWSAKSAGLAELAAELGLGLSDFVLFDDDPVECAEVRANAPEVLPLRLPATRAEIPHYLDHIWAFDRTSVTDEDRQRGERYRQERGRQAARAEAMTFGSFLADLRLRVTIDPCQERDLSRVAQLTRRTNQFTTTTARYDEPALRPLTRRVRCVRVTDRFGDYGLVGMMMFAIDGEVLRVTGMRLSCRALGRGVEHRMLAGLGAVAHEHGCARIMLEFTPTERNVPARQFLDTVAEPVPGGFTIAADAAARIEFHPVEQARPTPATSEPNPLPPRDVYRHIAENLRELDLIEAAVDARRVRRRPGLHTRFAEPDDELERTLTALWQRVLGVEEVGIDDKFFELGGKSLHAVQVMAELSDLLGVSLPTVDVFERTTVRAMATMLRAPDTTGTAGRQRGERRRRVREAR